MRRADLAGLVVLGALWGAAFLFIRIAAPVLGPVATIEARVVIAGVLLALVAWRRKRLPRLARWRDYLMLGTISAAAPFTLIAIAPLQITAGLAAILNATTPLFAAVLSARRLDEPLTARRRLGLALGIAGVTTIAGLGPLPLTWATLGAVTASLAAAALYAIGLLLFYRLIARIGATASFGVTYLVPLFGAVLGWAVLDEPLTAAVPIGASLVLTAVHLLNATPAART